MAGCIENPDEIRIPKDTEAAINLFLAENPWISIVHIQRKHSKYLPDILVDVLSIQVPQENGSRVYARIGTTEEALADGYIIGSLLFRSRRIISKALFGFISNTHGIRSS